LIKKTRLLLVDPARLAGDLEDSLAGFSVERVAPSALLSQFHEPDVEAALVASDLGEAGAGLDVVRAAVAAGCPVPLLLVTVGTDDAVSEAALLAGAASCVDLSRVVGRDLSFVIEFARANRLSVPQRNAQLLEGLAYYLSHEGRNALAGIRSGVQVVSDHLPAASSDRAMCEEIQERVLQFAAALDSLTLVLRPMTEPSRATVRLAKVIREEAARLPLGLDAEILGEEVSILANREQIGLLFSALLTNAAEAVDGNGQVKVSVESDGEWCVVKLTDRGPALDVSATDLSHMLDLFTTTKGVRAGMGLPVAKRIAEAHGGSLELSCAPASSLCVTVRLPLGE
jgi:signal transduction histidine kinase